MGAARHDWRDAGRHADRARARPGRARREADAVLRGARGAPDDPPAAPQHAWWVPGRLEVFGKHTDYAGGRTLVCCVPRGFAVVASPREDHIVRVVDALRGERHTVELSGAPASRTAAGGNTSKSPRTGSRATFRRAISAPTS